MGTAHTETMLRDLSTGNVLMYFPINSAVERIMVNDVKTFVRPWAQGGAVCVDIKQWALEIVIQGVFLSTDAPMDADFITAMRALNPVAWASPHIITAEEQYNWLADKLLTTDTFRLDYLNTSYQYSAGSVDIEAGQYPPVTPREFRCDEEGSIDRIPFTLRLSVGQPELE